MEKYMEQHYDKLHELIEDIIFTSHEKSYDLEEMSWRINLAFDLIIVYGKKYNNFISNEQIDSLIELSKQNKVSFAFDLEKLKTLETDLLDNHNVLKQSNKFEKEFRKDLEKKMKGR